MDVFEAEAMMILFTSSSVAGAKQVSRASSGTRQSPQVSHMLLLAGPIAGHSNGADSILKVVCNSITELCR